MATENLQQKIDDQTESGLSVRVIVHSFFIIPFLIAVFAVLIFAMVKLVVGSPPNLEQSLATISRGSETERWQAAMDLTAMLRARDQIQIEPQFLEQLSFEYRRSATERRPYLRTYLALAMGLIGDSRFEPDLIEGIDTPDLASKLAAIKSLGLTGGAAAEIVLTDLLADDEMAVVLEAVIALGRLGRTSAVPILMPFLDHPEANLRWDAALALGNLGDRSGLEIINQLLDRSYYQQYPQVDEIEQDRAISVALEMAKIWGDPIFKENLDKLSRNDPNLRIADAALKALQVMARAE